MMIPFPNSNHMNIPLEDVLSRIEQADHQEVEELIHALRNRFHEIHPDWEFFPYILQTGNKDSRTQQVKLLIDFLSVHYLKDE